LQAACRAVIADSRPRGELPDAAEHELLKRLAGQRPVAEQRGQWRIYAWGAGQPVLIGTRAFGTVVGENSATSPSGKSSHHSDRSVGTARSATAQPATLGTSLDETPYRVVIWGVAVPSTTNAWTLCLFQSNAAAGGEGQGGEKIPLPPGGHRLVSIRAAAGDAITAFSADDGNAARKFYDRWFADHGWAVAHGWQQIASSWHARFETRSRAPALAADIRLGFDLQGRWTGLVMESQLERVKL
jgi:hypothetical protein